MMGAGGSGSTSQGAVGRLIYHVGAELQQGGVVYLGEGVEGQAAVFVHRRRIVMQLGQAGDAHVAYGDFAAVFTEADEVERQVDGSANSDA